MENDGISGTLPTRTLVAVEYPGYVQNTERALETLGGLSSVGKAVTSKSELLELKYRPEDPYCHPLFGDHQESANLLLKVPKTRNQKQEFSPTDPNTLTGDFNEEEWQFTAEIVARIDTTFQFEGQADFQHIIRWSHDSARVDKASSKVAEQDEPMQLIPQLFCKHDLPDDQVIHEMEKEEKQRLAMVAQRVRSMAQPRPGTGSQQPAANRGAPPQDPVLQSGYDFSLPRVPQPLPETADVSMTEEERLVLSYLRPHLVDRPIWSIHALRTSMREEKVTSVGGRLLKRALSHISYSFSNGPFRSLWIRKGYDPRKDSTARKYQMLDFRVPHAWGLFFVDPKREASRGDPSHSWRDTCAFRRLPSRQTLFLQLCDLSDDAIQALVSRPADNLQCNETSGWFSRDTLEQIRDRVRFRFHQLLPNPSHVPLAFPRVRDPAQGFVRNERVVEDTEAMGEEEGGRGPREAAAPGRPTQLPHGRPVSTSGEAIGSVEGFEPGVDAAPLGGYPGEPSGATAEAGEKSGGRGLFSEGEEGEESDGEEEESEEEMGDSEEEELEGEESEFQQRRFESSLQGAEIQPISEIPTANFLALVSQLNQDNWHPLGGNTDDGMYDIYEDDEDEDEDEDDDDE